MNRPVPTSWIHNCRAALGCWLAVSRKDASPQSPASARRIPVRILSGNGVHRFRNHCSTSPEYAQGTANAQTQLQNAASSATANPIQPSTGTANLNNVVDKIAEVGNAQIKASAQQSAATGKVIEGVGRDIQAAIKDSASVGNAGASIGQMQTANAIKDGNASLGDKLDAIKDAIEKQDEGEDFPPVATANSTSKCDTRLCRLTVLFEYLDRLPESETFPRS
ncbi:hypothetical protein [Aeromonas hydrophila]|uniref:hypothetical protein n=1 Tax=Aeromonas hydrophila TaxID=644 RepID=UPI00167FFBA4|nr:hypothetical protein [Aeromonas hydrophila]